MPTTTKYIWDDDNYLAEADGSDTINVVYTNEPQQYGNLVSTRISSTTSYHHFDAIGSTRQLTNSLGKTTDVMAYDGWGNIAVRTGNASIAMLWIGRSGYYFDQETSLLYIRQRIYGPTIGRWTSFDPLGLADGTNRYEYVQNSPLLIIDPSGMAGTCSADSSPEPYIDPLLNKGGSEPRIGTMFGNLSTFGGCGSPAGDYGIWVTVDAAIPKTSGDGYIVNQGLAGTFIGLLAAQRAGNVTMDVAFTTSGKCKPALFYFRPGGLAQEINDFRIPRMYLFISIFCTLPCEQIPDFPIGDLACKGDNGQALVTFSGPPFTQLNNPKAPPVEYKGPGQQLLIKWSIDVIPKPCISCQYESCNASLEIEQVPAGFPLPAPQ